MARPLSIEALWRLERIGAVSLSPDGRQAVCAATHYDLDANRGQTSLWLLDTSGRKAARRLTTASGRLMQPAWSPRGDRIAFLAQREQQSRKDEQLQLFTIAPDGGEAVRLTNYAPGIEAFRWCPDGQSLLFSAWVWPDAKGAAGQAARVRRQAKRLETGYASSQAQVRQWDHLHPMDRVLHLHRVDLARSRVIDLFEATAWELPREDTTPVPFDCSPDGQTIAFAFDPAAVAVNGNRLGIALLDSRRKRFGVLADDAEWTYELPRWSPDGARLAVLAAPVGRDHTALRRPALIEPRSKLRQWQLLGLGWDHEASSAPRWAADGRSMLVTAEWAGRCHLWRCTLDDAGGRFDALVEGGWVQDFDLAGAGDRQCVVTLADSHRHPPRVHAHRPGREAVRLERFNDWAFAGISLGRSEEHSIRGAGDEPVQMWLTYPPRFDRRKRHPVMQVIHGGPYAAAGDTWSWRWNVHVLAGRGHVVAQVNYHGSSGFGHAFKRSIIGRLGALEFDDIEAGTDWLLRQRWVDRRRIYATGGSYGGFLCAWINGHAVPGRYRAHVCHAGVFDRVATFAADSWATRRHDLGAWYWEDQGQVLRQSPHAHAVRMNTPTLVIHGALDHRVPDCNGLAYYNTLKARGVDARLLWFPDENHWILKPANSVQWTGEFFAWLERHGSTAADRR